MDPSTTITRMRPAHLGQCINGIDLTWHSSTLVSRSTRPSQLPRLPFHVTLGSAFVPRCRHYPVLCRRGNWHANKWSMSFAETSLRTSRPATCGRRWRSSVSPTDWRRDITGNSAVTDINDVDIMTPRRKDEGWRNDCLVLRPERWRWGLCR